MSLMSLSSKEQFPYCSFLSSIFSLSSLSFVFTSLFFFLAVVFTKQLLLMLRLVSKRHHLLLRLLTLIHQLYAPHLPPMLHLASGTQRDAIT